MRTTALALAIIFLVLALSVALAQSQQGAQVYQQNCAVCHGNNGQGVRGPPLAGNNRIQDVQHIISQILNGGQAMPPFRGQLSDAQIAAVATHERNSWGNNFGPVTAEQVAAVRAGQPLPEAPAGGGQPGEEQAGQQAEQPAQPVGPAGPATVQLQTDNAAGELLVNGQGHILYYYRFDAPEGISHCYDPCVTRWVPLLTDGAPEAGQGLEADQLGTVQRDDGTMQVTYKGWPLYTFAGDQQPGDVAGTKISKVWLAASPELEDLGSQARQQGTGSEATGGAGSGGGATGGTGTQ